MKAITDTLIIGAGLSGLIAANTAQNSAYRVTILEKELLVGGQIATERMQGGLADYGAQFFTCHTATFQEQVDTWLEEGLIYIWSDEWSDGSLKRTASDKKPRYGVTGGMYQLTKQLADKIVDLRSGVSAKTIQWGGNHWLVQDSNNRIYTSRSLILTAPVPESLALLKNVALDMTDRQELERIYYSPCLCGLFIVEGELELPASGAVQDFSSEVYWIADNQVKGISARERIITMQLNKRYSERHFDDSDKDTLRYLEDELQPYLKSGAVIKAQELKKWRYSVPLTTYPDDILLAKGFPLIFAGAAFGGRGRIEGAYLSGLAAGQAVPKMLKNRNLSAAMSSSV